MALSGRAQLVAHVGQELRLVLARDLKLAALLIDLGKEVRVLDRQHRLGGECLEQIDGVLRKRAGRFASNHQRADYVVARQAAERPATPEIRRARRCLEQASRDWP